MNTERTVKPSGKSPPTDYEVRESSLSLLRSELNLRTQERDTYKQELERYKMLRPPEMGDSHATSPRLDRECYVDYEYLKIECERAFAELHTLKTKHNETARKCEHAVKEVEYFRSKHRTALQDRNQLESDRCELSSKLNAIMIEKQQLELEVSDAQNQRDADLKELTTLRQLYRENRRSLYGPEDDMYDLVVTDRENLQESYAALVGKYNQALEAHVATTRKCDAVEKENIRVKRACDEATAEKNLALGERNGLKQQNMSIMRKRDQALAERDVALEKLNVAHQHQKQLEAQRIQYHNAMLSRESELRRAEKERIATVQEYNQTMAERAIVHQEMDKLQDDLSTALTQITNMEMERKSALNEAETLRREIKSALDDRDKALKDCHDLREKLLSAENDVQRNLDSERHANEMNGLREEVESLKNGVGAAQREAETWKSRRDWAFNERDKIVMERDSMKILCDNLRRERDKALCDVAEARRDGDEQRKMKNQAVREVHELRERSDPRSYRDTRTRQLHSRLHNESRDSAIDADFASDVMSETFEVDLNAEPGQPGFDLSGGVDDPNCPTGLYVSHVMKGSPAEGKLQVSDFVLRVNNVDVVNADRKTALQALHSSNGTSTLLIRRRRSIKLIPKQLTFHFSIPPPNQIGLSVSRGLYISRLSSSSPLKDSGLCVGDRITHVVGEPVDERSPEDVRHLLETYENHSVDVNVVRYFANGNASHYGSDTSDSEQHSNRLSVGNTNPGSPVSQGRFAAHVGVQTDADLLRNDSTLRQKRPSDGKDRNGLKSLLSKSSKQRPNIIGYFPSADVKAHTTVKTTRISSGRDSKPGVMGWIEDKILRRERKERPSIELVPNTLTPEEAIEAIESVVEEYTSDHCSRSRSKQKIETHSQQISGGTWPKYRGPPSETADPTEPIRPPTKSRKSTHSLTLNARNAPWIYKEINYEGSPDVPPSPVQSVSTLRSNRNRDHRLSVPPDYNLHMLSSRSSPHDIRPRLSVYPESFDNIDTGSVSSSSDFVSSPRLHDTFVRSSDSYPHGLTPPVPVFENSHHLSSAQTDYSAFLSRISRGGPDFSQLQDRYGTMDQVYSKRPVILAVPEGGHSSPRIRMGNRRIDAKSSLSHMSSNSSSICSPITSPAPPLYETVRKKPLTGQRVIELDYQNETNSGFKLCSYDGEIYIASVAKGSAADRVGLVAGDQLLDVGGVNLRRADLGKAKMILMNSKKILKMIVEYRGPLPVGVEMGNSIHSPASSSATTSTDSLRGPTGTLRGALKSQEGLTGTLMGQDFDKPKAVYEPRVVTLAKGMTEPLGINLIGGNVHGIFIHSVQPNSPATGPNGLGCGEQILEYNGIDMKNLYLEKAMVELCKPVQNIQVIVQYNREKYELARSTAGDSLYVKTLWERDKSQLQDEDLMFHKDDILFIDNTLYNGEMGSWRAWMIGPNAQRTGDCGIVPNKYNAEEEVLRLQQSNSDLLEALDPNRQSSRRSLFKRRKHSRQNGRELASFSNSSLGTDTFSVALEEPLIPTYLKVERIQYEESRPVLILGPLADVVSQELLSRYSNRFARCPALASRQSPAYDDSEIIEVRQCSSGLWETVLVQSVREIAAKRQHALMDVNLTSVERMQSFNIQPVILVMKFKTPNAIREVREGAFNSAKISAKIAKELFEAARLEAGNPNAIIVSVPDGTSLTYIVSLVEKAVKEAQTTPQWIPTGIVS